MLTEVFRGAPQFLHEMLGDQLGYATTASIQIIFPVHHSSVSVPQIVHNIYIGIMA
jgi:hypothetical protein